VSENRLKIGVFFKGIESVSAKISGRRGCPHNHSSCHKTRWTALLYCI